MTSGPGGSKSGRLIVLAGLPGAGKSTLAHRLAVELPAVWLRVDTVEAALLKAGIPRSFETGLAAYVAVADLAREHLANGHDVVIDAVNGVLPARRMWRELGSEFGTEPFVVEVRCSDRVEHRRRVESRASATPPLPPPTWEEVEDREYLPWTEPVLVVDTVRPLEETVRTILASVRARPR